MVTVRIWDLPTRLFHWTLAASVLGLVITGNWGGEAMPWHFRFGYLVLSLLLFRFSWGIFGGHWSRWSQLPLSPANLLAYFRGQRSVLFMAGHNPLGSLSVIALMFFLSLQVATGLVSDDEIANMGPLSSQVSNAMVSLATSWHKHWGKFMVIILVTLHLLALAWYRYQKKQSLVPAMWHGSKELPEVVPPSIDNWRSRLLALFVFLLSVLAVNGILSLGN